MARTTAADANKDNAKLVEDKVRALPANQGKNEWDMWQAIDTEITEATNNSTFKDNIVSRDKHRNK